MAARKFGRLAWVVTTRTLGFGDEIDRVLLLLQATRSTDYVRDLVHLMDTMLTTEMKHQFDDLALRKRDPLRRLVAVQSGGVDMYTLEDPLQIRAQKSRILGVEDREDGEWLRWHPIPWPIVNKDTASGHLVVSGKQMFPIREARRMPFDLGALFQ